MRLNTLLITLVLMILLSSCKTTPVSTSPEEESPPVSTESGNSGTVSEEGPPPVSDSPALEASELRQELTLVVETPSMTELPPRTKERPPRGGMKRRLGPENPILGSEPDPAEETPPVQTIPEDIAMTIENPQRDEPLVQTAPAEETPAENSLITDAAALPSEYETPPYNPLRPIIIIPEDRAAETITEEKIPPEQAIPAEKPPTREPTVAAGIRSELPEALNPIQEDLPIPAEDYTLSSDPSGKLIIQLQGSGWIYLSSKGESSIVLTDKTYEPASERTRFVFSSRGTDGFNTEMVFLKQDLLRGESSQRTLTIDSQNNPLVLPQTITEEADSLQSTPTSSVTESLPEPLPAPLTEDTAIMGAESAGNNESSVTNPAEDSINGAGETLISEFPPRGLNAAQLLEMAEQYERPGADQSLEKALLLYEMIRKDYPVTLERFTAESRIRYLNKHYFKVQ